MGVEEVRRWVGRQVMERRLRLKLSQRSLGRLVKLSQTTVCRIERGRGGLPVEVAYFLARLFGCKVDDLVQPPPQRRLPGSGELEGN